LIIGLIIIGLARNCEFKNAQWLGPFG